MTLTKYIILTLLVLVGLVTAFAQTEFQGEVSGEWDIEGSPYIQIGAANVPQRQSLSIRPGVEVILHREQEFVVNGRLSAIGTEEDSIRIQPNDTGQTAKILFNGETLRMSFCRIDSFYQAIKIQQGSLTIENCFFYDNEYSVVSIRGDFRIDFRNNKILMADDGRGSIVTCPPGTDPA